MDGSTSSSCGRSARSRRTASRRRRRRRPSCHKTSSSSHPYTLILVPSSALPSHQGHGDIIPAPAAGCPGGSGDGGGGQKCNSGRGNGSEGDSSQLIQPGTGSRGTSPTTDCDPGNSGSKNSGGD